LVFVAAADDDASIFPTSSEVEVVAGGVEVLNAAKRVVVVVLVIPLCRAKCRFCTISPREKQNASTTAREYPRVIAFVLALDRANDAKTGVVVVLVAAVVLFLARRRRNGEAEEELSTPIADERRRLNPSAALGRRRRRKNVVVVIGAFLPDVLLSMSSFEREWSFCAQKYDDDSRKQKAEKSFLGGTLSARSRRQRIRATHATNVCGISTGKLCVL